MDVQDAARRFDSQPWFQALEGHEKRFAREAAAKHPDWSASRLKRWLRLIAKRRCRVLNYQQHLRNPNK